VTISCCLETTPEELKANRSITTRNKREHGQHFLSTSINNDAVLVDQLPSQRWWANAPPKESTRQSPSGRAPSSREHLYSIHKRRHVGWSDHASYLVRYGRNRPVLTSSPSRSDLLQQGHAVFASYPMVTTITTATDGQL
jgi:hypothetical protein